MRSMLWFLLSSLLIQGQTARAQDSLEQQVVRVMRQASEYYYQNLSTRGGYVYYYSLDLSQRWGEGVATQDQIWVQPPGTPTVGSAFLLAYQATHDAFYLEAAEAAGHALIYGQLQSGGWTNCVDFDPSGARSANYRNGRGKGKDNSSLDDGQTQSAISFLIQLDQALEFGDSSIHEAVSIGLDALLAAQYPNGGFPQVWTGPVVSQPALAASYPEYDWRTEGRIKNYWEMYTINDNVTGNVAHALMLAHATYGEARYLDALRKLGDFLILAQLPQPQPGWAQQYSYDMHPIWARKFEPPAVSGDETQEVIATLLEIASVTGDPKYLAPIPDALQWLQRSILPDGRFARYYELRTNRALYMNRSGDSYSLTYDDTDLPSHYGWKTESQLAELENEYLRVRSASRSLVASSNKAVSRDDVQQILNELDSQGRWVSRFGPELMVGQPKMPLGSEFLSSQKFSENISQLSRWLSANAALR